MTLVGERPAVNDHAFASLGEREREREVAVVVPPLFNTLVVSVHPPTHSWFLALVLGSSGTVSGILHRCAHSVNMLPVRLAHTD